MSNIRRLDSIVDNCNEKARRGRNSGYSGRSRLTVILDLLH